MPSVFRADAPGIVVIRTIHRVNGKVRIETTVLGNQVDELPVIGEPHSVERKSESLMIGFSVRKIRRTVGISERGARFPSGTDVAVSPDLYGRVLAFGAVVFLIGTVQTSPCPDALRRVAQLSH